MNYATLASQETVEKTSAALSERGFEAISVSTKEAALEKIKELIPAGATVTNGASETLEEIGFIEYLKSGTHGWENLHEAVLAETDKAKQAKLRKESTIADYYLGSAHALTENGELAIASNTGSQMPSITYNAANLIFVVGTQKIVADLPTALRRIDEYVVPLEDVNIQKKYGIHTMHAKTLILHRENPMLGRKVRVIMVNEKLGF